MKKLHFKNGVYTDGRSQKIIEEVERLIEEARQPLPGSRQSRQVTAEMENAFYGQVVKLDQRGRLFGLGCMSQMLHQQSGPARPSQPTPINDPRYLELESKFTELEKTIVPRIDLIQSTLEEYMQNTRTSRPPRPPRSCASS